MENVTLNQKEQARLQVLNSLLAGHMTIEQASTLMGVSIRHAWRILAAYRKEGAAALAHPPALEIPLHLDVLPGAASTFWRTLNGPEKAKSRQQGQRAGGFQGQGGSQHGSGPKSAANRLTDLETCPSRYSWW